MYPLHSTRRVNPMADLPPGVIPVSADEYDRLYPRYELEAKAGETFQQWLKADRRKAAAKRTRLVKTSANSIGENP
jgi:hypothetical protein